MGKLKITLAPEEIIPYEERSEMDKLLLSVEPIQSPFFSKAPCAEGKCDMVYYGHDHNSDYYHCVECGRIEET